MSRRIPALLLDHLQQPVTTTCRLIRFDLANGSSFGLCSLDRDITYRGLVYRSFTGFDPSNVATNAGLSVANEAPDALLSPDDDVVPGLTFRMVASGDLDNALWTTYLINWANPEAEAAILDMGDVGQVKISDWQVYTPEMLSFAMRLRQNIGQVWSRRCRATFGTPAGTHTGCGVDTENMWHECEVTAVDPLDDQRIFADSGNIIADMKFPARVQWLTGDNASSVRLYQIEAYSTVSGTVAMFEPVPFPIKVGDTYRIRKDCNKSPSDCIAYGNFINYQGEPFIPVGDGLETMTPGAQVFGGLNGSTISG